MQKTESPLVGSQHCI